MNSIVNDLLWFLTQHFSLSFSLWICRKITLTPMWFEERLLCKTYFIFWHQSFAFNWTPPPLQNCAKWFDDMVNMISLHHLKILIYEIWTYPNHPFKTYNRDMPRWCYREILSLTIKYFTLLIHQEDFSFIKL